MSVGTYKTASANLESSFITYEEVGLVQANAVPYGIWGASQNIYGELGIGRTGSMGEILPLGIPVFYSTPTNSATPVSFTTGGWWNSQASTMLKSDNSLWVWGRNDYGQLGDGSTSNRYNPTRLGTETYSYITAGNQYHNAIRTDGTLWSWGRNESGQLGIGNIIHRSSPVQVGALTVWSVLSAGENHTIATRTDGSLWGWGNNGSGEIGDSTRTDRSSPVQITAVTGWSIISSGNAFNVARKSNGTLWTWGWTQDGRLANGSSALNRSSPIQIGALTDWSQVAAGDGTAFGIKTTGTLWAWGYNGWGLIGDGTFTHRSSPVQIGALTNWSKVSPSPSTIMALKTDGTLWGWGAAWGYQMGIFNEDEYSSPIQITSYTDWTDVWADGYGTTFAKRGELYGRT